MIFTLRPVDGTSKRTAGALGIYHLGPVVRAGERAWSGSHGGESELYGEAFGGPFLHLSVHLLVLGGFSWTALMGVEGEEEMRQGAKEKSQ